MARGRKSSLLVSLTDDERGELESLLRRTTVRAGVARRARMVLLRAEGHSILEVSRRVGVAPRVVYKWLKRYRKEGPHSLGDKPRPGRPAVFSPRGRDPSGQDSLRETGQVRPEPVPMGLYRAGA